ncbi:hypothetical protein MS3_00007484 [Schistosoma haematobium]|uniref:Uncharacterized protein n=1 Tax=Schistosoma haematobium TaxID=6185 RepID=A0A922LVE9_SCHHA|nr:hypothetical protein MS3_00007484 [Schistosoma haematobium]KAH9594657.1 hypothetical protein MS3_00007484 [Schistosoma haematobium]
MFTQTVESFNNVLSLIEISDGTFARYVRDHLLARKHKWSTAFRPSATLLQLNNTNFVETSHRILKMHQLSRKTPVLRSIFSVLLRVGYWMEARLQKYTSDCRVKANIGQEPAMRGLQERLTPAACQVLRRHLRTPLTEFVMSADFTTPLMHRGNVDLDETLSNDEDDVVSINSEELTERDIQNEEDEENRLCDICNLAQPPYETGDEVGWVFCPCEAMFHRFCAYDPSPNVRAVHCPMCGAITN